MKKSIHNNIAYFLLVFCLAIPVISVAQSDSNVLDFRISYSQQLDTISNKINNTVEVVFDKEFITNARKGYIKVARVSDSGAQDIFQKVIENYDELQHLIDSNGNEIILNDYELIIIVRNVPNDHYEVFLRIDNMAGEIFTGWKEIVLEEPLVEQVP